MSDIPGSGDRRLRPVVADSMRLPLSDAQRQVVEFERLDRHMVIVAPPGSGKTLTITRRIAHLLSHGFASADQILALTFTERAANELSTRLSDMTLPGVSAATFHGRCFSLLKEHAPATRRAPQLALWSEQQQLDAIREAAAAAGLAHLGKPRLRNVKQALSRWKCSQLRIADVLGQTGLSESQTTRVFAGYREILDGNGALDFDDLIIRAADLLWNDREAAQRIHNRYRFVFIDEFQDVSPEQYRLLSALAPARMPGRQVIVVADDNQAIFGFRGANPREMLSRFRRDYRPLDMGLRENYRSVGPIVGAAKSLIRAGGVSEHSRAVRPGGFAIVRKGHETARHEAQWIARQVSRLAAHGYRLEQIAALYRSHKRAELIEAALVQNGIGVRRIQPGRFYDQADVQEIIRYFELVASTHERSFINAVNWPRFLVDEITMNELRRLAKAFGLGVGELAERTDLLREYASPLTASVVERFMNDVVLPVRQRGSRPARDQVVHMLDLLACRRDPIPRASRATFRATLDELARGLNEPAAILHRASHGQRPVKLVHDEQEDSVLAASLLRRVLTGYLGIHVLDDSADDWECCVVALGPGTQPGDAEIVLSAVPDGASPCTTTARAYRLCQLLLLMQERPASGRFVALDLETTSDRTDSAEMLSIGAVVVENGEVTGETFSTLVRPSSREAMTTDAFNVHGITWEHVASAPPEADMLGPLLEFVGDATLVGHNVQRFDLPVLSRACGRTGLPAPDNLLVDTLLLARRLRPGMPNALDDLLTTDERRLRQRHDALVDARLTAGVFLRLLDTLLRDREVDVLTEELPLVAASIQVSGMEETPDNALLVTAGARAFRFGLDQQPPTEAAGWLIQHSSVEGVNRLRRADPGRERDDEAWDRLEAGWIDVVGTFEATWRNQTLEELIDFVSLATPSDLDSGTADRVSMMTVYSAKGH